MNCTILHESSGRIRVHLHQRRMTIKQADLLVCYLEQQPAVHTAVVYERTCHAVIRYDGSRTEIISALARFRYDSDEVKKLTPIDSGRTLNRAYQEQLVGMVAARLARTLFLPAPLQAAYTVYRALRYWKVGIACLIRGKIQVEVLDALSIGISVLRQDYATAGSVMFLLRLGELLEEWTHKRSVGELARSMALHVDRAWLVTEEGDVLVPITQIQPGDKVRVRAGNLIPLDGAVCEGEATVNQAAMTGEAVPVVKRSGSTVYAGTAVDEGECVFTASAVSGDNRYDRIVAMIEQSERMQSTTIHQAARLADRLVPACLAGTVLTYALTRSTVRASSILMVDFSCALKLSMPLAFLSAMSEAGRHHITVKGGSFFEKIAAADTIVFDKTGTLTRACPTVAEVIPFDGSDPGEMLRLAACLEEHFPHSVANAVVRAARERRLEHEEMHATVEYIVAHGIASTVQGERVVIGSHHFVFEDEGCTVPAHEQERFSALPLEYTHLYLAIGGVLRAVICISDPVRPEADAVLTTLRRLGLRRQVMMTGDSSRTAAAIAAQIGVDDYCAEVLPEDKAAFVEECRAAGHTVIMVGDGINDAPALSAADVGIAISDGAAIAREIADVTIAADDLFQLGTLRLLSGALMLRTRRNYRFIMGFNSALIVLGALGILPPATSALLHNASTLLVGLENMSNLLTD